MDYQQCHEIAQTRKRKLANNTYLNCDHAPESYAIRLHSTDVVTFKKDGRIVLDSGGYQTMTTKDRLNTYAPARVYQDNGVWYVNGEPFADGFTIHPDGTTSGHGEDPKAANKLRRQIRAYAKAFVVALRAGDISKPSSGDCWGCCMATNKGEHPMGGRDHILSHIEEVYFVPSLLVNACERFGASDMAKHNIACMWSGQPEKAMDSDFLWQQIQKMIARWCYQETGLPS